MTRLVQASPWRPATAAAVLLAGCAASAARAQTSPDPPRNLRFERSIAISSGSDQQPVCAALDAAVMAHSGSAAHNDLRLIAQSSAAGQPVEQPFVLTESGPAAVETAVLTPTHLQAADSTLQFDLTLPPRPWADLTLALSARNFVATARVWGSAQPGGPRQPLGTFPVFDLDGLGRGTTLPLAESTLRFLHVELQMRSRDGRPLPGVAAAMLGAVTVPPSRERQTLYTEVQSTAAFETVPAPSGGTRTVALLRVPAHLPVERLAVTLDPAFSANFRRPLTVLAWPSHPLEAPAMQPATGPVFITTGNASATAAGSGEIEAIPAGDLSRVRLPSGDPGLRPLDQEQMTADAVLGANLRDAAAVEVAIDNGTEPPLPVRSVSLLMRRRSVCFRAEPATRYWLSYGDPGLPPPELDAGLRLDGPVVEAALGEELLNPTDNVDSSRKPYLAAHPDTIWALAIALAAALGGTALHRVKRAGGTG